MGWVLRSHRTPIPVTLLWEKLRPWLTGACCAALWVGWTNVCVTPGMSWMLWWGACLPRRPTTGPGGREIGHTSMHGGWLGSPSPTWCLYYSRTYGEAPRAA